MTVPIDRATVAAPAGLYVTDISGAGERHVLEADLPAAMAWHPDADR